MQLCFTLLQFGWNFFLSPINTLGVFGFGQMRFNLNTKLIILNMCAQLKALVFADKP